MILMKTLKGIRLKRISCYVNLTKLRSLIIGLIAALLTACGASSPPKLSDGHLQAVQGPTGNIPKPVTQAPFLPPPRPTPRQEVYTVVVNEVSVKELLFAIARDAKLNVDIHPKITGKVTLNAIKQTMPQILNRIADQVDLRYEVNGSNLIISPDTPYFHTYKIDYLNMARKSNSEVSVATQIATAGGTVGKGGGGSSGSSGNKSKTEVNNTSENDFWKTLVLNINGILGIKSISDKSDAAEEGAIIVSPLSGIISVKATSRQHEQIQAFLDKVLVNAQRQVLIEATIVEVELNDRFQSGVDWQRLSDNGGLGGNGVSIISSLTGANLSTSPFFALGYNKSTGAGGNISAAIRMLETFGDVKVLSSPKIMALNNQTALLKVVDEKVYFTVDRQEELATANSPGQVTFTSEIHTVPVGLVMSVTPQISEDSSVTMNIRPTISRITGYAVDPAPKLLLADARFGDTSFDNLIPEIQVREIESLLRVNNAQTVVLGGLMQNKTNKADNGIPLLSNLPLIGNLFSYRDDNFTKTELIIFLRPTIIQNASLDGDLHDFRRYLPEMKNRNIREEPEPAEQKVPSPNEKAKD